MASEARLVINRNPDDPAKSVDPGKMTQARATADNIKAERKRIHGQAARDRSGVDATPPPDVPTDPPPVREDIESVEFTSPDGRVFEYGPRTDISLVDRIARMYNGRDPTISEFRLTRILMGIRSIDGHPPVTIVDEVTRTKLANQVGDENIDLLMYFDRVNWPPLQQSELPVIKKKLRT